jgi:azurin
MKYAPPPSRNKPGLRVVGTCLAGMLLILTACATGQRQPTSTPVVHRAATALVEPTGTPDPDETSVPTPDGSAATDVPADASVLSVESASGAKDFKYVQQTLEATAGTKITLIFRNKTNAKDEVGHNWVLVKPGTEEAVIKSGFAAGDDKDWLDVRDPNIIAHTRLIEGAQEDTITFDAPPAGTYTFLSTFPEQYAAGMKGTLVIKPATAAAVTQAQAAAATATPAAAAAGNASSPTPDPAQKNFEDFDPATFNNSAVITHPMFPLKPGMQFTYEGQTDHNGKTVPHRFIMTITDLTKTIGGVRSLVAWDRDYADGQLVEAELAFYAQDDAQTVWLMGEYPEEYEGGRRVKAPAWMHGAEDARAGIIMPAKLVAGSPSYSQGWGPAVGWTDRGQVRETGAKVCVAVKCYEGVLVIAETSATEVGAYQLKYFAPNVGNIRVDWLGTDVTQEKLELVKIEQLDAAAMEQMRAEALRHEQSAYDSGNAAYAKTPPLESPVPAAAATAAPAAATSGEVASTLLEIQVQAEEVLDFVPANNWKGVNTSIAAVEELWASYKAQVIKDGAAPATVEAFEKHLAALKSAAAAKTSGATLQSANALTAVVVDLSDVYKPAIPTDLGRLDVLERQVVLDVDAGDLKAAAATLDKITSIWANLKPFMLEHKADAQVKQFDRSLAEQATALKEGDGAALKEEALNALEIVDALEKTL